MASPTVAIIGTCDTKLHELLYLRDEIRNVHKLNTLLIDVGFNPTQSSDIDITQRDIVSKLQPSDTDIFQLPRGEYIQRISIHTGNYLISLYREKKIHGVISAGGSGGTALSSNAMQVLLFGFPKMIVSTIASGDTTEILGGTDIMLMYSVVDVAGLNKLLRQVLSNAAAAISGAAIAYASRAQTAEQSEEKTRIGITMFGVTTPGVDAIRKHLESNYNVETYVFHATGTGGKAMERLVFEHELDGLIDLTTTEVTDDIMGGVMSAGPHRLLNAVSTGIPSIISLGATDMANFGAPKTVPDKYKDYKIHHHNPLVTLVRSSAKECIEIGNHICDSLKAANKPATIELWIPKGGVSAISTPGGPFEDKEADKALFDTITSGLEGSGIKVVQDARDVNDKDFAVDIAEALVAKMELKKQE